MRDSDALLVGQRTATYDLLEAKLGAPVVRPGSVSRAALVNRLRASHAASVVTVSAPAGYGKTTLLAQWSERDERRFAWVSYDDDDNDPLIFTRYVAASLARVQYVDEAVFDALRTRRSLTAHGVARLASAFRSAPTPVVLVVDDVHVLRSRECLKVVAALVQHVPDGSALVLCGRTLPRLAFARLRAMGCLFALERRDLELSGRETERLVRSVGAELAPAEVAEVADWGEGWAAGTYLAALALKGRPAEARSAALRDDRFVDDYFDLEHLSRLEPDDIRFLTRTAVLERMSGPLCDAVLESSDAAQRLESLARANLFLVPLDPRRTWYRYHNVFREFLQSELERREPNLVHKLGRRAAAWCEAEGRLEDALHYAHAAGDLATVARLVGRLAPSLCAAGRAATVEPWLEWFDEERLAEHPTVALAGAWVHLLRGRPHAAARWLAHAERAHAEGLPEDGSPSLALLRAAMCRDGVEAMLADAEMASHELAPGSRWRPTAVLLRGVALLLTGELDDADESLAEAVEAAESSGAPALAAAALAERALLAASRGDELVADRTAEKARALIEGTDLVDGVIGALVLAVSARRALGHGNLVQARADLAEAHEAAARSTHALPWCAVQALCELGRLDLRMLDGDRARECLAAAGRILRRRPELGSLRAEVDALRVEAETASGPHAGRGRAMTAAELRLLPLLATHLSFREIAERLYVSRNTVKTQAISMYRKLDASSRSEAISRATELGLVGAPSSPGQADFIRSG
jgi:LuxR family maltose regulon positive regulatory protein